MTVQEALMVAGQASAIMAVLLLALAARTYVLEDIRGVADDLSGRKRMRGMRDAREKVARVVGHTGGVPEPNLSESPTQAWERDFDEGVTVAHARKMSESASFVVTRDVVVCPGGDL